MNTQMLTRAALLGVIVASATWAQPKCGIQSVFGQWAYNLTGWTYPSGASAAIPVVGIGVFSVDWSGKVTGSATWGIALALPGTVPGQMLEYDFQSGSIQVTSDCTGFLTTYLKIKGTPLPVLGPFTGRIIVLPDKGEILAMSFTAPGSDKPMWAYTLRRLSPVPGSIEWPAPPAQ